MLSSSNGSTFHRDAPVAASAAADGVVFISHHSANVHHDVLLLGQGTSILQEPHCMLLLLSACVSAASA
jgi:hypothetical protein